LMASLHIQPIQSPSFTAEALLDGSEIVVRFCGTADLGVKAIMDTFLNEVHIEASHLNVAAVNVDISGLEFINSSCLVAMVTWITAVQAMAHRSYLISFHFKAVRDWHHRTFGVLEEIGQGVVAVQSRPAEVAGAADAADATRMVPPRRTAH
jgi:anti-anti-sigma regulatory factor